MPAHWAGSDLWSFVQGDDLTLELPVTEFDVLFIDTSHFYAHTLTELRRFVPLVKPGGTVLLHDTLLAHVDSEDLPFPDDSFDAVINIESSHTYPNFSRFLAEVARVLRPGGHFLYTDVRNTPDIAAWEAALADADDRVEPLHCD